MLVTYAGTEYDIPDLWLSGYCQSHGHCHPREAVAYWLDQEALAEQWAREHDQETPLSSGTRPRIDDQAPAQAEVRPGGDRAVQGRSGGREGC